MCFPTVIQEVIQDTHKSDRWIRVRTCFPGRFDTTQRLHAVEQEMKLFTFSMDNLRRFVIKPTSAGEKYVDRFNAYNYIKDNSEPVDNGLVMTTQGD